MLNPGRGTQPFLSTSRELSRALRISIFFLFFAITFLPLGISEGTGGSTGGESEAEETGSTSVLGAYKVAADTVVEWVCSNGLCKAIVGLICAEAGDGLFGGSYGGGSADGTGLCRPKTPCGNGQRDAGEGCDDGNVVKGDGCDNVCQGEIPTCTAGANFLNVPAGGSLNNLQPVTYQVKWTNGNVVIDNLNPGKNDSNNGAVQGFASILLPGAGGFTLNFAGKATPAGGNELTTINAINVAIPGGLNTVAVNCPAVAINVAKAMAQGNLALVGANPNPIGLGKPINFTATYTTNLPQGQQQGIDCTIPDPIQGGVIDLKGKMAPGNDNVASKCQNQNGQHIFAMTCTDSNGNVTAQNVNVTCGSCGDGVIDQGPDSMEECDDGNVIPGDGCSDCKRDACSITCPNPVSSTSGGAVTSTCNVVNGSGAALTTTTPTICSVAGNMITCLPGPGGDCSVSDTNGVAIGVSSSSSAAPSSCTATVLCPPVDCNNNGTLDPGEECDDGNSQDCDGCSRKCKTTYPDYECVKSCAVDGETKLVCGSPYLMEGTNNCACTTCTSESC